MNEQNSKRGTSRKFKAIFITLTSILLALLIAAGTGLYMLYDNLQQAQNSISKLTAELAQLNEDFNGLSAELDDASSQLNEANSRISELEKQLKTKTDELNKSKEENQSLEKEIEKLESEIQELKKKLNNKSVITTGNKKPVKNSGSGKGKGKTVYLTFDDGPSSNTPKILEILNEYDACATFFVIGTGNYNKYMTDIVESGNAIALHSYTHDYAKIYASEKAYYKDLDKISKLVTDKTGVTVKLIRFPGGSSNTISNNYSSGIMKKLVKSATKKGYVYFDWNVNSGDAEWPSPSADRITANVIEGSESVSTPIVLLHDTDDKDETVKALPEILEYYIREGYTFGTLDSDSYTAHHLDP